ncbi:MAG: hypothetical protein ABS38_12785 [Acidovorax sp. SCN 68-22]|nr:MAG: hypothetical protein ABS38_12785 [Acidovorax sp. SCN 68-22]
MIAAVGVEDRSSILQGFTVYLQGLTGDKMIIFYANTAGEANEQARAIHGIAADWMEKSASVIGQTPVRLKLTGDANGAA